MSSWHYTKDGQAVGPIPFESLRQLAASGELPDGTLVWTQGMPDWLPPSEVPGLSNPNTATPAEPGTAPPASENPYAAPSSAANLAINPTVSDLEDIAPGSESLRIDMLLSKSWDVFKRNIGIIFGFGIIYTVIAVAAALAFNEIFPSSGKVVNIGLGDKFVLPPQDSIPAQILGNILSLFLGLGAIRFGLNLFKGQNASISDLFSQGRLLVRSILAMIIVYITLAAVAIPGFAVIYTSFRMGEDGWPNITIFLLGLLIFIIPCAFVGMRMLFVQYSLVDRDSTFIDAIKDSWALTKSNVLQLILLIIVQILLVIAGALALLVGLIIALPILFLTNFAAYLFLRHGWRAAAIE